MIEIIPNWHPIFVNFTVALFVVSMLLHVVVLLAPKAPWRNACLAAAHWNLALGAVFALITVGTGLNAYYTVAHDSPSHAAMTDHRNWAFVTASIIVVVALWRWTRRRRDTQPSLLLAITLVLAGGLLTVTAWKGAELVFRYGLGVMALVEAEGPGHSHEHDNDENDGDEHASHEHGSTNAAPAQEQAPSAHAEHDHNGHDHGGQAVSAPKDGPVFALNSFHAALNSGDKQTVIAALSPDVLIFESGGAERSRAEYASHHMKSDMAFLAQMEHDEISQNASEQGDTAWIVTESRIYGRYKDKDIDIASTETAVLKRGEDGWKIVHLHWSSQ
ncbi:MAG: DUF2231 domain-containing protein [Proteobacteria bacterium]|nr:DUF2231 domain-containing protein [Pseudomonadota bacterium]